MPGQLGDRVAKPVVIYSAAGLPLNIVGTPVVLYDVNGNAIPPALSGTFANRPTSPLVGTQYFATDLGSGVMILWNGFNWKPASGVACIGAATVNQSVTGVLTETVLGSFTIPAGLLSVNGNVRFQTTYTYTNSANTKTMQTRFAAAAGITGSIVQNAGTTTTGNARLGGTVANNNSVSAQYAVDSSSFYGVSGNSFMTPAINTAVASTLSFNGFLSNIAEVITLVGYIVEWLEP